MTFFNYFDLLQVIFWSIAYICVIIYSIKFKKCLMPFTCLSFNMMWEVLVLLNSTPFSFAFFLRLIRTILDSVILIVHFLYGNVVIDKERKELFYLISICLPILILILFYFLYEFVPSFSLYSAFFTNIYMSLMFLFLFQKSKKFESGLFKIGLFRMLGTLFASITYGIINEINVTIIVCGLIILAIDSIYLSLCNFNIKNKALSNEDFGESDQLPWRI